MMFKFIHAADVHLDSPLRGLADYEGCPSDRLRSAPREAFEAMIGLAVDQEVDFIINYDIKYRMGGADEKEE